MQKKYKSRQKLQKENRQKINYMRGEHMNKGRESLDVSPQARDPSNK